MGGDFLELTGASGQRGPVTIVFLRASWAVLGGRRVVLFSTFITNHVCNTNASAETYRIWGKTRGPIKDQDKGHFCECSQYQLTYVFCQFE